MVGGEEMAGRAEGVRIGSKCPREYYAGQVSHDLEQVVDALGVHITTSTGSTIATGDQQCFTT